MKSRQIEEAGLCWKCRMKIEIFEVLWDKIALTKFDIDIEILWYNVSEGRRQMETILSVSIEDTMHRTLGNSGGEDVHWLYSTLYYRVHVGAEASFLSWDWTNISGQFSCPQTLPSQCGV